MAKIEQLLPLSPLQKGLLFHAMNGDRPEVYQVQIAVELVGPLDVQALQSAAQRILARHSTLRAGFVTGSMNEPIQVIVDEVENPWTICDLSSSPEPDREALNVQKAEYLEPFSISKPSNIRFKLIRMEMQRHRFLMSFHHLLLDGWSSSMLMRELFHIYYYPNSSLGPVVPYADYLGWLNSVDSERARAKWASVFATMDGRALLFPEASGATTKSGPASSLAELTETRTAELTRFARSTGLTMSTLIQASWAITLSYLSGTRDVCFGVTRASRPAEIEDIENAIGLFINTVPLRFQINLQETMRELANRLQNEQVELLPYSHVGLDEIQRVAGGGNLFDTLVVFENYPSGQNYIEESQALKVIPVPGFGGNISHYPLTLIVVPGRKISITLSYNPDIIVKGKAEEILKKLIFTLEEISQSPELRLQDFRILSEIEHSEILSQGRGEEHPPSSGCVHELFEIQAAESPISVAIYDEDRVLNYGDLAQAVGRLADILKNVGVGPETIVAVAFPRSAELIASLLAIMKAGAAYLPLDLDSPAARVTEMLIDASPVCIVGFEEKLLEIKSDIPKISLDKFLSDEEFEVIGYYEFSKSDQEYRITPQNVAYLIYTSGSTGKPKGVAVTHEACVNRLLWMQSAYKFCSQDRILQKTPITFDVSVWELFCSLISGGSVIICRPEGHKDPEYLAKVMEKRGVTVVHFVPSMLRAYLSQSTFEGLQVREVICSGEVLPLDLYDTMIKFDRLRLSNLYGPTEAAIDVTAWREGTEVGASIPIGGPIWNAEIYILDDALRPVAEGVTGDLYLGGLPLARGYWRRPDLTADRFVASPFSQRGNRMYRTGDLARWLPNGTIEFRGRRDRQVKLRGFRIELGEIEEVLRCEEGISDAAVVVHMDASGRGLLLAYVLAAQGVTLNENYFLKRLADKLPPHLLPSSLIFVTKFPKTRSGKLDVASLPLPNFQSKDKSAPASESEALFVTLFCEVLGLAEVGVTDNFFRMGGDSILSIQLVGRARKAGLIITAGDVFRFPTPRDLASLSAVSSIVPMKREVILPKIIPVTPIMAWFFERSPDAHFTQSFSVRLPGRVSRQHIEAAAQFLIDHHDALRIKIIGNGNLQVKPVGSVRVSDILVELKSPRLGKALDIQLTEACQVAAAALSPTDGDLVRIVWSQGGGRGEGQVVFIIHHLAVDGVSWRIIVSDFESILEALLNDHPPQLSFSGTPFALWASVLLENAHKPETMSELPFWQRIVMSDDPPLSSRALSPESDTFETSKSFTKRLTHGASDRLIVAARDDFEADINVVLLTALAIAVLQWRSHRGVAFTSNLLLDVEGHGREQIEPEIDLSHTVGWFTSLYPISIDPGLAVSEDMLSNKADIVRAFRRVREQLSEVPRQGIGYGQLRYLNTESANSLKTAPSPQIAFNYLGRFDTALPSKLLLESDVSPIGGSIGASTSLGHSIEVTAVISLHEGAPNVSSTWTWASDLFEHSEIEGLSNLWMEALEAIALHASNIFPDPEVGEVSKFEQPFITNVEQNNPHLALVAEAARGLLEIPDLGIDDDILALPVGSQKLAVIRRQIEARLGLQFVHQDLQKKSTIRGLSDAIITAAPEDPFSEVAIMGEGREMDENIFCFHPIGGVSWSYIPLASSFEFRRMCGLQSLRLPPYTTLEELADLHLVNIRKLQPEGPYRLLGWSLGGTIAHKVACRLGPENVFSLVMLDAYPAPRQLPVFDEEQDWRCNAMTDYVHSLGPAVMKRSHVYQKIKENMLLVEEDPTDIFSGEVLFIRASDHDKNPIFIWGDRIGSMIVKYSEKEHMDMLSLSGAEEASSFIQDYLSLGNSFRGDNYE